MCKTTGSTGVLNGRDSGSCLTSLSKTVSQESQEDQRASGTVIEFSQDRACHKEWNVSVNGSCYPLLEQAGGMFYNEMLCCAI